MPELPEVETVRRSLAAHVLGLKIVDVEIQHPGMVMGLDPEAFRRRMIGQTFADIERYGKYLAFRFESGAYWMAHLRMTGQLIVTHERKPMSPHLRMAIVTHTGLVIQFIDIRKFARAAFAPNRSSLLSLFRLGIEPLKKEFTVSALKSTLTGRARIKSALLDQRRIAGLGNIYADEALFAAGIHPERRLHTLSEAEIARLHQAIETCLRAALEHGGTTIRNFVQGEGKEGDYAARLAVYGRQGEPCKRCGTKLQKIAVGGRGTTFCPQCQR